MDRTPDEGGRANRLRLADIGIGGAMLVLAFIGVAASDVYGGGSQGLWTLIALGFALGSLALDWLHGGAARSSRGMLRLAAHWLGVIAAIQLVYVFVAAGRLNNADDGLMNGALLGLGAFLCGVHGNWRMLVIGAAIGVAAAAVALLEQYLWLLAAVVALALAALVLISRGRGRLRRAERLG